MGFWASASSKVSAVRDWGMDQAVHAAEWSAQKAKEGKDWAVERAVEAKEWAVEKSEQVKDLAFNKKEQIKDVIRQDVRTIARAVAKSAVGNKDLLSSWDRRKEFTSPTVSKCNLSGPPIEYDGYYLGEDCKNPTPTKPGRGGGHKPEGCKNCGKQFPTLTYTNGIDNTLDDACATLQAIADELCVEVIGVFNASYKSAVLPPRSNAETMALLRAGVKDGVAGAETGTKLVAPTAAAMAPASGVGAAGVLGMGAATGAVVGSTKGVASTYVSQQIARWAPQSQDAIDVVGTLNGTSIQPASRILGDDIASSLRAGEDVNLLGHSEGGVNTVAAIARAKRKLEDDASIRLMTANPALGDKEASAQAAVDVERLMAEKMHVTLVGTQQTGLPPGPNYRRIANKMDVIPDAIAGAQASIGRPGYDAEPKSLGKPAPPVERFPRVVSRRKLIGLDTKSVTEAHSMTLSYVPYIREADGRAKGTPCC